MRMAGKMGFTVEAIYAAGVLKLLTPLHEVPEPEHTKVCLTAEALPVAAPNERVISDPYDFPYASFFIKQLL